MKKRTRSILQELSLAAHKKDHQHLIETRGENLIESAIRIIEEIYRNYDAEVAGDLERRFINSIRNRDTKRFIVGIKRASINENT